MAENNSSAPLLPCPFCGGAAAVQKESPAGGGYFVDCKSCRASTNLRYACGDNPVPLLMERWNARAAQAVEAQAAPAALEVKDDYRAWYNEAMEASNEAGFVGLSAADTIRALAATPTLPATEDSSAGDLAELKALKAKTACCMGVGGGDGNLFVYGDYDSIKAAQALVLRAEAQAEVQAEPVSSDPVAWHSKLYGTCWMHKQPYHLDAGTHFFVRGNPNPVATVLSGAAIQWHTGTAAFEHGTFFYTAPQSQPADAAIAEKAAKYDRLVPYLCKTCSGFGIVGGHCQDGSFDSQPCPDCNQPTHTLTQAVLDVLAERARQIEDKGYEPEADDVYEDAQLAAAAATYALLATGADGWRVDDHWPWSAELSLKKGEPRRMLEKAGALILAEMERLDRAAAAQEGGKA